MGLTVSLAEAKLSDAAPLLSATEAAETTPITLYVPDMHCAACMSRVEKSLQALSGVAAARAGLSNRTVSVDCAKDAELAPEDLTEALGQAGFQAHYLANPLTAASEQQQQLSKLLWAIGVAGFAAANIMLLSVSVWAGAEGATRDLLHLISAVIAIPAVIYAGRPFYHGAWQGLRHGRMTMDLPISVAVLSATAVSLWEARTGGTHAWFDAAVMLLFFLLIGRYLDQRMRARANQAAAMLTAIALRPATIIAADGRRQQVMAEAVRAGHVIEVRPGERIVADGVIQHGASDIDAAFVSGESVPVPAAVGDQVHAGSINLTGLLHIEVQEAGAETLLAEMARQLDDARAQQGRFVKLADQAAEIYVPVVHGLALVVFLGWLWFSAAGWHQALLNGISVLIITCPCALGLAVPVVQVIAGSRLFRRGILLKDGLALEKLPQIDQVLFDKTGTLTLAQLKITQWPDLSDQDLAKVAALAAASHHPVAKALAQALEARGLRPAALDNIQEIPGQGMQAEDRGQRLRLGHGNFCGAPPAATGAAGGEASLWFAQGAVAPVRFGYSQQLQEDAAPVLQALQKSGLNVAILSGDSIYAVNQAAAEIGIDAATGAMTPFDKTGQIAQLQKAGQSVMMVGDGINDAPALAMADVSLSPAHATDIAQNAASIVYLGGRLSAILEIFHTAHHARRLMLQNIFIAIGYNAIAIPIAALGYATPLIAALAMSASSLVVTLNAVRLWHMAEVEP